MSGLFEDPLLLATVCVGLAVLLILLILLTPSRAVAGRRRLGVKEKPSALTRSTGKVTGLIDKSMAGERRAVWERALDRAGLKTGPAEFIILVGAGALVALALGLLAGGPVAGVMLAGFAVAAAVAGVTIRSDRRKAAFAEQLDDILALLASNLRAGHSLPQALDSLTGDIEEPASSEIIRAVTQVRVGRDLTEALSDVAERMDSDDFRWITQAIAIHRQVGGNLAEVLDTVANTIRERGQVRRQVSSLSAEGRLSAYVLIALPFSVVLFLSLVNPGYLAVFTATTIGWVMLAVAAVLLVVGIFWLRATVKVEF
ncbi:MAG TPA: type II secretion system F family protein [Jiangellaceae bacterium]